MRLVYLPIHLPAKSSKLSPMDGYGLLLSSTLRIPGAIFCVHASKKVEIVRLKRRVGGHCNGANGWGGGVRVMPETGCDGSKEKHVSNEKTRVGWGI